MVLHSPRRQRILFMFDLLTSHEIWALDDDTNLHMLASKQLRREVESRRYELARYMLPYSFNKPIPLYILPRISNSTFTLQRVGRIYKSSNKGTFFGPYHSNNKMRSIHYCRIKAISEVYKRSRNRSVILDGDKSVLLMACTLKSVTSISLVCRN